MQERIISALTALFFFMFMHIRAFLTVLVYYMKKTRGSSIRLHFEMQKNELRDRILR